MIIVKIQGGLGNQMFQWAFGTKLSKEYEVFFDISFFNQNFEETFTTRREFFLDDIIKNKIKTPDIQAINSIANLYFHNVEDNFSFFNPVVRSDQNYIFNGYWQSEKYFMEIKDEILDSLVLPTIKDLDFSNSCSIHVRRGDYIKAQHVHPIQSIDYYNKALDIIQPKGKIFVFSDDIEWCKINFNYNNVIFMKNNTSIQDLKMMSLCEDNIIANSSFSWWGAWLNQNKNKRVVCPKNWFADSTNDSDIKPSTWIQI